MPKISVIIPVYNSEKYLSECLDSVVNQTLNDIEIICINDCSTDCSLSILKKYAKTDSRIKIINLEKNSGASFARNIGIDCAHGEYIGFVDSDDFIDLSFYEKLFEKSLLNDADAVKGNIYNYYQDTKVTELSDFYNMNDKIRENQAYFYYGFTSAIYKKSFLDKFRIRFPQGIKYFEDPYFSICACLNYKNVFFDDDAKYYYRKHEESLSSDFIKLSNFEDFHLAVKNIIQIMNNDKNITQSSYLIIINFLYSFIVDNYYNIQLDKDLKEYMFDIIVDIFVGSKYQLRIPSNIYKRFLEKIIDNKYYEIMLKYYKEYDWLNKDKITVKIFVSYIKPSFLFKSEILTPIHLGRAVERSLSKDGEVKDDDIKWLHYNCIGDDDFGENISDLIRRVGFFTGTYWAWKNYEKLGNPDYFGSFGYRRLLLPNCLNNIQDYDFIVPCKKSFNETLKSQMINVHGQELFDAMINIVNRVCPEQLNDCIDYFNSFEGYYAELYIMKRQMFFEFCDFVHKMMNCFFELYPDTIILPPKSQRDLNALFIDFVGEEAEFDREKIHQKELRDFAFIIERMTGYYLYQKTMDKSLKYKEVAVFEPFFSVPDLSPEIFHKKVINKMRENVIKSIRSQNA